MFQVVVLQKGSCINNIPITFSCLFATPKLYSQKLRVYSQMVYVFWQKVCVYSRMVRECSAFILWKLIEIVKRHLHNICAQLNMFSCGWIKIVFYWLLNTYREIIFLFWSVFNIIKQISTGVEGNMHWFY